MRDVSGWGARARQPQPEQGQKSKSTAVCLTRKGTGDLAWGILNIRLPALLRLCCSDVCYITNFGLQLDGIFLLGPSNTLSVMKH